MRQLFIILALSCSFSLGYGQISGPKDLSGLVIWLRADTGITKDGADKVSQWDDISGSANHATQGTAGNQAEAARALEQSLAIGRASPYYGQAEVTHLLAVYDASVMKSISRLTSTSSSVSLIPLETVGRNRYPMPTRVPWPN